jgi:hypothetical protein
MNRIPGATDKNSNSNSFDVKEKSYCVKGDIETSTEEDVTNEIVVLQNEREIATRVISVDDDPSLSPWTFRAFFIGLGLSAFGGSLGKAVNIIQSKVSLTCSAS